MQVLGILCHKLVEWVPSIVAEEAYRRKQVDCKAHLQALEQHTQVLGVPCHKVMLETVEGEVVHIQKVQGTEVHHTPEHLQVHSMQTQNLTRETGREINVMRCVSLSR